MIPPYLKLISTGLIFFSFEIIPLFLLIHYLAYYENRHFKNLPRDDHLFKKYG